MPGQLGGAPTCPACEDRVYFSEEKTYMSRSWHKKCFKCGQCNKQLESTTAHMVEGERGDSLMCTACVRHQTQQQRQQEPKETYINKEDLECCPRCGMRVYFAEQMLGLGRKFHKTCFTCGSCNKHVDAPHAADHDGELYCRSCHSRLFGPKGYGFAGGSGTGLSMDTGKAGDNPTDHIPKTAQAYIAPSAANKENNGEDATDAANAIRLGGGDVCPRCNLQVFIAERRQAAGNVYHNSCFTCSVCRKKLDSGTLTEKQDEIYCKRCYALNFGPKGYGFGNGAGILQMN